MGTYFRQLRALKNLRQLDVQLKSVWTPAVGRSKRRRHENLHTPQPLLSKTDDWYRKITTSSLPKTTEVSSESKQNPTFESKLRTQRAKTTDRDEKRSAQLIIAQATLVSQAVRNSKKR